MMKLRFSLLLLCFLSCSALVGRAEEQPPQCHVMIVGGIPGSPLFAKRYQDWIGRFRTYFVKEAGVPEGNIVIYSGDKTWKPGFDVKSASLNEVKTGFTTLGKAIQPQDQFVLIMVGHGATVDDRTTLALPGEDVSANDLARGMAGIKAKQQVVLYLAGGAGDTVDELAQPGRILVCASSPGQIVEPIFAEFFLNALETKRADGEAAPKGGKKDGIVTLLEAYNWAANQTANWIRRIRSVEMTKWKVDGQESIELFKKLYVGDKDVQGVKVLSGQSNSKVKDPTFPLGKVGVDRKTILGLRIITENAMLEDAGEKEGLAAVRTDKYQPLTGTKKGEPGALAGHTVLGKPGQFSSK